MMRHIKAYSQLFESQTELTPEQIEWLDECTTGRWKLNPQTGLVDVDGEFYCQDQNLTDFKGVRFGEISKFFDCSRNSLTSLDGAPQKVGGGFRCYSNKLTSLEGAPQRVGGDFICHSNQLVSLKGSPQIVTGSFYCSSNQLTSLDGAPPMVSGTFFCSGNVISETAIERVLNRMSRNSIPLEQAVSELWAVIPDEDKIYLAKHHPELTPEEKREYAALARHKKRLI
jgi:hypothetical protein